MQLYIYTLVGDGAQLFFHAAKERLKGIKSKMNRVKKNIHDF